MAEHNDELLAYCNDKRIAGRQEYLDQTNVVKQLLEVFCECDTKQFVIIDGLDECRESDRKLLVDFWKSMVDKTSVYKPGKLRVLLVSQDIAEIRDSLKSSITSTILDLNPSDTDKDIRRYFQKQAPVIQARFKLSPEKICRVQEILCERAQGKADHNNSKLAFID